MNKDICRPRRKFVSQAAAGAFVTGGLLPCMVAAQENRDKGIITPPEDLMREHGVAQRLLLIYEAANDRLTSEQSFDTNVLAEAASINRKFIENYHERLEEEYIFPRFRKANKMTELVDILDTQHQAGRKVTDIVLELAGKSSALSDPDSRTRLSRALQNYIRMYRPHVAHEDTELFPKLQQIVSPSEYMSLSEVFEEREQSLFGKNGFDKIVKRVESLEKDLGIESLKQFTPPSSEA